MEQFVGEKLTHCVTVIFLFSCLKNDNCSRFQNLNKSLFGQLLANPLPNLYSRDTSTVYSGDSPDSFSQF